MNEVKELDKTSFYRELKVGKTYMLAIGNKMPAFKLQFDKMLVKLIKYTTRCGVKVGVKVEILWAHSSNDIYGKINYYYIYVDDWGQIFFQEYSESEVEKFLVAESL